MNILYRHRSIFIPLFFVVCVIDAPSQALDDKSELRLSVDHYLEKVSKVVSTNKNSQLKEFESFFLEDVACREASQECVDKQGRTKVVGYVTLLSGTMLRMSSAYLIRNKLGQYEWIEFQTVYGWDGVSFRFRGRFVGTWKITRNYEQIWLHGRLTKYKGSRAIVSRSMRFTIYGEQ